MATVHPSALVEDGADLAAGVVVGPFTYVQSGVKIGPDTRLDSHVAVLSGTTIGARCRVSQGAILGGDPQDIKYAGQPTRLEIGDDNIIREYVTIHRGSGEDSATVVGSRCFLMAFVHLGHNCVLHNDIVITNNCGLAGHVTLEDGVNIGGMAGIHQFVRVGQYAMVAGMSRIVRDCPPYMQSGGIEQTVFDINAVGLRRRGITQESRLALHKACKLLFKSQIAMSAAVEIVEREVPMTPEVKYLLAFVERSRQGKNGRGDQK